MPRIKGLREAAFWVLAGLSLILLLALLSYSPADPAFSVAGGDELVTNRMGPAGAWFADIAFLLFGASAYLVPDSRADRRRVPVPRRRAARESGRSSGAAPGSCSSSRRARGSRRCISSRRRSARDGRRHPRPARRPRSRVRARFARHDGAVARAVAGGRAARDRRVVDRDHGSHGPRRLSAASRRCNEWLGDARIWWEGRRAKQQRDEVVSKVRAKPKTAAPRIEPSSRRSKSAPRASASGSSASAKCRCSSRRSRTSCRRCRCSTIRRRRRAATRAEALEAMSRLVELKLNDFGVEAEVVAVHPGPGRHALRAQAGGRASRAARSAISPRTSRARSRRSACASSRSSPASRSSVSRFRTRFARSSRSARS